MTVSDYIWQYLADQGVTHVFYLPGGGCMHLVDALARQDRIKPVACLTEYDASRAALGYAITKNDLGVCLVTTGPGGTNAVTACAAAWIDSVPVLFISGQVPTHLRMHNGERQRGPQEVDILCIVKGICKFVSQDMQSLDALCVEALAYPSGPAWLDIPLDVQGASIA